MPQNLNRRYRVLRAELIARLGGSCVFCGGDEKLEFHHPHGKNWRSRDINGVTRLHRYENDYERGNLELRCKLHHDELRKKEVYEEPVPF